MSTKVWTYGESWEHYPIEEGEIWQAGTGVVAVHNLFNPLPKFLKKADALFIDPPWNLGNVNSFYTKAGRTDYLYEYRKFADRLFACIAEIRPRICYLEIGEAEATNFKMRLHPLFRCVDAWNVTYYKRHPCILLKGSEWPHTGTNFEGIDEAECIKIITKEEDYECIGDLCMGRGLVGFHAFKAGRSFVGTELNKRRLAVLLADIAKAGGEVKRVS